MSRDPSEIILICWFAAHETFIIITNVENSWKNSKEHAKEQYFVTVQMSLLTLLINLKHPCWIKLIILPPKNKNKVLIFLRSKPSVHSNIGGENQLNLILFF